MWQETWRATRDLTSLLIRAAFKNSRHALECRCGKVLFQDSVQTLDIFLTLSSSSVLQEVDPDFEWSQWRVNRLVRVGLGTLARCRHWATVDLIFSFSLHAKHAVFTAAYFPAVCPALATWFQIIQWPRDASNRDEDAEAHKKVEWLADSHTAGKAENQYANLA